MSAVLEVVLLVPGARIPTRGSAGSAGLDLYAREEARIPARGRARIGLGIGLGIPSGFVGLLRDRSGLALHRGLTVLAGVIDSDFRGEVQVVIQNHGTEDHHVIPGDRIAQLLVLPCPILEVVLVGSMDETERGDGGFGSTGS